MKEKVDEIQKIMNINDWALKISKENQKLRELSNDNKDLSIYLSEKDIMDCIKAKIKTTNIPYSIFNDEIKFNQLLDNYNVIQISDLYSKLNYKVSIKRKFNKNIHKDNTFWGFNIIQYRNMSEMITYTGMYLNEQIRPIENNINHLNRCIEDFINIQYELKEVLDKNVGVYEYSLFSKYQSLKSQDKTRKKLTVNKEKNITLLINYNDYQNIILELKTQLLRKYENLTYKELKTLSIDKEFNIGKVGGLLNEIIKEYRIS